MDAKSLKLVKEFFLPNEKFQLSDLRGFFFSILTTFLVFFRESSLGINHADLLPNNFAFPER